MTAISSSGAVAGSTNRKALASGVPGAACPELCPEVPFLVGAPDLWWERTPVPENGQWHGSSLRVTLSTSPTVLAPMGTVVAALGTERGGTMAGLGATVASLPAATRRA
jgi:hypothetical protein